MTENEQIEEMARLMEEPCVGSCKECECYAHQFSLPCMDLKRAKTIYTKGYRKVERGEWVIQNLQKSGVVGSWRCTACQIVTNRATDFCPWCGADMRGDGNDT